MKTHKAIFGVFTAMILGMFVLTACSTEDSSEIKVQAKLNHKESIFNDGKFINFAQKFLDNSVKYAKYQQSILGDNTSKFIESLENERLSIVEVENIYESAGLNFDEILDYETTNFNLRLGLLYDFPETDEMDENEINGLIVDGTRHLLLNGSINLNDPIYTTNEITPDEIWYCVVEAVGIGGASAIGLKELKKQGIKVITKAVTKLLAKFAGPIGAAIMVADFGFCLYRADQD